MMTCTFQNDEEMLSKALELFTLTAKKLNGTSGTWNFGNQYHPVPKIYTRHSIEKGGNVLGLDRASSNLVGEFAPCLQQKTAVRCLFERDRVLMPEMTVV